VPRSQGCRITMMNGAAISYSYTSARHTTTDDSTVAAELTEGHFASSDVMGFRTLISEVGCFQEEPTVLYQDNQPAIKTANNRGSLARIISQRRWIFGCSASAIASRTVL
jgi:hypothetical protein